MLLNVCCAPCCLPIIEHLFLKFPKTDLTLFFDGPNLYPALEFDKRLAATRKAAELYSIKLFEGQYNYEEWNQFVRENIPQPPESYPENGARCLACFKFRLDRTAAFAKENSFQSFASTLSVSCHKDTGFINDYGKKVGQKLGLDYVSFDLDAKAAHRSGVEISKKYNLYRQKYCGCEFSLPREVSR